MNNFIGCDAHKKYSLFDVSEIEGKEQLVRVEHNKEDYRQFLKLLPKNCVIAIETIGSWYWIADEMEDCGHTVCLTNAGKAKKMMGQINKTDKLDAKGLTRLLKNGTLLKCLDST